MQIMDEPPVQEKVHIISDYWCIRHVQMKKYYVLELSFNSNEFGKVLLVMPSMFGKLEVHASEVVWRFEPITFYIGELRVKLILATHV